jgi:hypothetical protein
MYLRKKNYRLSSEVRTSDFILRLDFINLIIYLLSRNKHIITLFIVNAVKFRSFPAAMVTPRLFMTSSHFRTVENGEESN